MNKLVVKKLTTFSIIFMILFSFLVLSIDASHAKPQTDELSFDTRINLLLKIINMPSAVICLTKNDSIVFFKPYGYKDLYKREKAKIDTIYCLGSVSKVITAVALMQLYEKGYFDLDDDISNYLGFKVENPRYPNKNITFRMLLSHQAGFNDFGIKVVKLPYMLIQARLLNNSSKLIKEMLTPDGKAYSKRFFNRFEPGEKAMYDEISYILAGQLVEKLSGLSLEEYCQRYLFRPLDMKDTSFEIKKLDKSRIARPYASILQINTPLPNYEFVFLDAAAGLWSTTGDLSHLLLALINNGTYNGSRILKEETINIMHTRQYPESYDTFLGLLFRGKIKVQHGLGWFFIDIFNLKLEGHAGGAPGYSCHFYITKNDANETIGIIVLGNGPLLFPSIISSSLVIKGYEAILKLLIEKANECK